VLGDLKFNNEAIMFSKEDFKVDSLPELMSFLLVMPFVGLVLPFLLAAYTLGWALDMVGWLDT
jgi:hypothetical protein